MRREALGAFAIRAAKVMLFLGALVLCVVKLKTSLWLDETVTYWVVKDGSLLDAMRRTLDFPPQSLAYTPIAWAAVKIGGARETALRLPSLAAVALAVYLLYRLGTRLLDREAGFIAALLFAYAFGPGNATNARQYGLAMLAIIASTLLFVRWIEVGGLSHATAYILVVAGFLYLQPLYAPMLLMHLLLAWELDRWNFPCLTAVFAIIGILSAPLIWQLWSVRNRTGALTFSRIPAWSDLAPFLVLFGLFASLLAIAQRRLPFKAPILTLLAWTILPLPLLVALAHATGVAMVVPRYFAYAVPGVILTIAAVLRAFGPVSRVVAVALCVVLAGLLSFNAGTFENWRAGAEHVRALALSADTPILVRSGLPEAREWFRVPDRVPYLLAPLAFYPVPGHPIPLPYNLDGAALDYLEHDVVPSLRAVDRFVIFAHDYEFSRGERLRFQWWFNAHLPNFRSREVWRDGHLMVTVFERPTYIPIAPSNRAGASFRNTAP